MDAFWQYWNSLTPGVRDGIIGGLISGVAATSVVGVCKVLGISLFAGTRRVLRAGARRILRGEQPPAPTLPPAPPPLVIKVESSQPPALPAPPPKTGDSASPAAVSPIPRPPVVGFVARHDAGGRNVVERLKEELAPQRDQLVTLSGSGGIGKTTLAAQAARELKEVFGGRIVWSEVTRAGYTLSTLLDDVATQLGAPELRKLAPDDKEQQVRALVADPPCLIVLDNCETIADTEQQRIASWFEHTPCPALLTSRPKIDKTCNISIAAMRPDEAQELLTKLIAQTQEPQMFSEEVRLSIYETAEANPFLIGWIVAQIDAAQEPRTVLKELAQGEGEVAQRVFKRSFNLPQLGDDGRATLLALSLFAPSASRLALAEVAGFGDDERRINEAIRNLRALWLIKGILENSRFTIEGLTRSLTKSRLLNDARADEFRRRFAAYFRSYTEAHEQPTPEEWDVLEAEKDNILSAMDTAFEMEDRGSVQSLASVMANPVTGVLGVRGYWDEAKRCNKQGLAAARASTDEETIAAFTHNVAVLHQQQGEIEEAQRLYSESLEINKRLGNQRGIASTLHQLGWLAQGQGEIEEARRLYGESLEIKKRLGHQSGIASSLHQLAMLAQVQGEIEEARRLYSESLDIEKRLGDQSGIAITLHALANLVRDQGELTEARRLYNESLESTEKLGDKSNIALLRLNMGSLAEKEGNKAEAARLYREALSMFEKLGSPYAETARQDLERVESESSEDESSGA
ncbi:MAG: tetratricopeptide repeat protein [Pyrinomonadaceae bacterium]